MLCLCLQTRVLIKKYDAELLHDFYCLIEAAMIKVTNIPDGTSKDALLFFFENRRKSGGGSVDDLEYDPDTKSAVITFEEPEGWISYT